MHQDRGRLPPGRPLSLRANQATSLPGGPMRHTAREEPHAPIRAAVLSIRVCGTAAEPHAPIRATVPPALVCGAAPACRSCADRATRGRHHRRAAKTPCTNSAARRRCADRASRGPAASRRAAKTPCTNSPSQPPPRSGDRQQPWRRRDRGSCTVRTGPLANQVTHSRVRTPCTCSLTARRDRAATPMSSGGISISTGFNSPPPPPGSGALAISSKDPLHQFRPPFRQHRAAGAGKTPCT